MAWTKAREKTLGPVKVSPQTKILRKFFPEGRGRLEGRIVSGFFSSDSPEVREKGQMTCKWIMGGLFCVFTWDEWTYDGSKRINPIHGYSIVGWDSLDGEYRMLRAANLGVLHQLAGKLDGNRLVFVSEETLIKGEPTRVRYSFVRSRPKVIAWVAEISVRGGAWKLVSEDTLTYS